MTHPTDSGSIWAKIASLHVGSRMENRKENTGLPASCFRRLSMAAQKRSSLPHDTLPSLAWIKSGGVLGQANTFIRGLNDCAPFPEARPSWTETGNFRVGALLLDKAKNTSNLIDIRVA